MVIIGAVRRIRILLLALGAALLCAGTAWAGPVNFLIDSEPPALGRIVVMDFNPSTVASKAETPGSIAFLLPAHWRFDPRAVSRECNPAQAAAVRCPAASQVGFGHSVIQFTGYLFPGGQTQVVAYINAFLGPPRQAGDRASLVLEVEALGAKPFIVAANRYLAQKLKEKYSIIGRVVPLRSGAYGLEASFSGFPGGYTVPPQLAAAGVTASVTRFKLQIGAVRRFKKPIVHRFSEPTATGGTQTLKVHDHILLGHHLFQRPLLCSAARQWPWEIQVGFPEGTQDITGTVGCGGR